VEPKARPNFRLSVHWNLTQMTVAVSRRLPLTTSD